MLCAQLIGLCAVKTLSCIPALSTLLAPSAALMPRERAPKLCLKCLKLFPLDHFRLASTGMRSKGLTKTCAECRNSWPVALGPTESSDLRALKPSTPD